MHKNGLNHLIQHQRSCYALFSYLVANFYCKVSLYILNSEIIFKTLTHVSFPSPFILANQIRFYPGPKILNFFSCLTQLRMKFQMLIKLKMVKNKDFSCFQTLRCCIYHANKCKNTNNCWHFNIYENSKFQLLAF